MTPERWVEIERRYHEALEQTGVARASLLADACAGDAALREVESLLAQGSAAVDVLSTPAAARRGVIMGDGASLVGQIRVHRR